LEDKETLSPLKVIFEDGYEEIESNTHRTGAEERPDNSDQIFLPKTETTEPIQILLKGHHIPTMLIISRLQTERQTPW